jgi:TctA family transporter
MDLLHNLDIGFGVALAARSLLYTLIGVVLGTLVSVLPGIGPRCCCRRSMHSMPPRP